MRRPSPSLALSSLALLIALGGTAAAAGGLVTSRDIKDRTIQIRDLSPAAVKALRGQTGSPGAAGQPGPAGEQGAPGPAGANGGFDPTKVTRVIGARVSVAPGASEGMIAQCPPNTVAVSGGFNVYSGALRPTSDLPNADLTLYTIQLYNEGSTTGEGLATAVCAAR